MRVFLPLILIVLVSAWTTVEADDDGDDVIPKCEFEKLLDPSLLCRMYDATSKTVYPKDQKFCACPSYSECIRKDLIDSLTKKVVSYRFMCYKSPAPVDNIDFQDMTDGLYREDPVDQLRLEKNKKAAELKKRQEKKEEKLQESHYN